MPQLIRTLCCSGLIVSGCHIASGLGDVDEVSTTGDGGSTVSVSSNGSGAGGEAGQGGAGGDASFCGDGEVNQATEECDGGDGVPVDTARCDDDCTLVVCGDSHINQAAGEVCDDGNRTNGDGCNSQCVLESCGNMVVDPGEDCDDGNANNNDDCLDNCVNASCGDGFIHNQGAASESCDDGNANDGDGCSSACAREAGACCTGEPSSCMVGPFNLTGMALNNAIPDNGHPANLACETFNFMNMGCGNVADVNVTIGVDHSYVGDLIVRLEGPDTTQQQLMSKPNNESNFWPANLVAGFPVTYDDAAATSANDMGAGLSNNQVVCQSAASPCEYAPDPDNLSTYNGMSAVGAWTLCVSDDEAGDNGTLQAVDILIATQ